MHRCFLTFALAAISLAVVESAAIEVAHADPQRSAKTRQIITPPADPFVSASGVSASGGGASSWASSNVVAEARRWIGKNPTRRRSLWCARFMNFVLKRTGYEGTGSDMARSFTKYGRRISGPRVGAIAIMSRGRRGGHVGVVSGIDKNGNPIIISGNHGNRVAETTYPRGRIRAYVMPRS